MGFSIYSYKEYSYVYVFRVSYVQWGQGSVGDGTKYRYRATQGAASDDIHISDLADRGEGGPRGGFLEGSC